MFQKLKVLLLLRGLGLTPLLNCVQEMMEHSSDSESEPDSPDVVIAAYLKEPNLPMFELIPNPLDPDNPTKDALLYWKQNEVSNPILAKLARRFVSPPPGSVPSERLFSTAADIATDKRNRLFLIRLRCCYF